MDIISSNKNDRIRSVAALQKQKKSRTEQGLFVAEGLRITVDAVRSARELIDSVYMSETFFEARGWEEYPELAANGFPDAFCMYVVKDTVFNTMSETVTPQGILTVMKQPGYRYEDIVSPEENGLKLLILEDVRDPGNLGTMVRTAEAAGMDGIIMSRGTADIFSPKVTRSTMGAIFRVPFMYTDSLTDTLDRLKGDGVTVYAAYLREGTPFNDIGYASRAAVMIGNEGDGLSDGAVAHASQNVFIPMAGEVESLNAAVAAALLMYRLQ